MTRPASNSLDEYRTQLDHCANSLAIARDKEIQKYLPEGVTVGMVEMFTEGNLDKRLDKLTNQVELLSGEFDDLDELIGVYIRTVPLRAYDTSTTDGDRFLDWLSRRESLTTEQLDLVICQRSRHQVELAAQQKRIEHLRFQDLRSVADALAAEFSRDPSVCIEINPIHHQAEFATSILLGDEDLDLPAQAMFFPVGNDVRTAVMEPISLRVVGALRAAGAAPFDELCNVLDELPREIAEACDDLVDVGLAVFR